MKNEIIYNLSLKYLLNECILNNKYLILNKFYQELFSNSQCQVIKKNNKYYCLHHDKIILYIFKFYISMKKILYLNVHEQLNLGRIYIHKNNEITIEEIKNIVHKNKIKILGCCCSNKGIILNFHDCQKFFEL